MNRAEIARVSCWGSCRSLSLTESSRVCGFGLAASRAVVLMAYSRFAQSRKTSLVTLVLSTVDGLRVQSEGASHSLSVGVFSENGVGVVRGNAQIGVLGRRKADPLTMWTPTHLFAFLLGMWRCVFYMRRRRRGVDRVYAESCCVSQCSRSCSTLGVVCVSVRVRVSRVPEKAGGRSCSFVIDAVSQPRCCPHSVCVAVRVFGRLALSLLSYSTVLLVRLGNFHVVGLSRDIQTDP